jgi:transposase
VLLLSAGNINDISTAEPLIQAAGSFRTLLADKAYDADHLRRRLAGRGTEALIPSTTSRRAPIPYDALAYRDRNRVERMWCRLKEFRRVATRYDKIAAHYLSAVLIAAICAYRLKGVRASRRHPRSRQMGQVHGAGVGRNRAGAANLALSPPSLAAGALKLAYGGAVWRSFRVVPLPAEPA